MTDGSNHGFGFSSFRSRINMVSEAFGNDNYIRRAIAEEFKEALVREQRHRLPPNSYETPDWTAASDTQFENAGWAMEHRLSKDLQGAVTGRASWRSGTQLELRGDTAYLVGGGYALLVGLISTMSVYDTRAQGNIQKWMPFITDTGLICISGSRYAHGELKSTNARTEASAVVSLKGLMERHFKIKFDKEAPA